MATKLEILKTLINQSDKVQVALIEAIEEVKNNTNVLPYKLLAGAMSQTESNEPTSVIFVNELGGELVWTRSDIGHFVLTLTGKFTVGKTFINTIGMVTSGTVSIEVLDIDTIDFIFANDNVTNFVFEVRVYN
jgi:hypothetical protein